MAEAHKNFYEILGLQPDAKAGEISKVFRELVRKNHPDLFPDPEEKSAAEKLLKDITEAYNTLSKPPLRKKYDESLAEPKAQVSQHKSAQELSREMLLQGKGRLRMGDHNGALTLFDHVLKSEPENPEALFCAGMIRLRNAQWRNQGVVQVEKAIALAPYVVSYVVDYAKFLIESGQLLRAQKLLETGVYQHNNDPVLTALLAKARGEKPGGAGFSLFGKKK